MLAISDLPNSENPEFRADVLRGLASTPKAIPARWLYDQRGSELFDAITQLPTYYPTATETDLLRSVMPDITGRVGPDRAVVEFGAGSLTKTPLLLEAVRPAIYVPVDISGDFLRSSAAALAAKLPGIAIQPVEADFTGPIDLPAALQSHAVLGFFPGSTIGNFVPWSATDLLRRFRQTLGTGALLLIGMDRMKPVERLLAAYDEPEGVTASFNLNLLSRINRELGGTIPVDSFRHEARWSDMLGRIEMHLVADRAVRFTVSGKPFELSAGESIHTENSHKYGPRSGRTLLLAGGWTPLTEWTDPAKDFSVILAEAQPERTAP